MCEQLVVSVVGPTENNHSVALASPPLITSNMFGALTVGPARCCTLAIHYFDSPSK